MRFTLPGSREMIRSRSARCALQMVRFHLMGVPLEALSWGERGAPDRSMEDSAAP